MQVGPLYALHEVVLAVFRSSVMSGLIVPSSMGYDEQKNITQNTLMAENTKGVLYARNLGSIWL